MCSKDLLLQPRLREVEVSQYLSRYQDLPRISGYCRSCKKYGMQWVCPPFTHDLGSWRLEQYTHLLLVGCKVVIPTEVKTLPSNALEQELLGNRIMAAARSVLDPLILQMEQRISNAVAYYAGRCHLCGDHPCSRLEQHSCRYPDRMRTSLEALGCDMIQTASTLFDTPMQWSQGFALPDYYFLIAGVAAHQSLAPYLSLDQQYTAMLYL